MAPQLNAIGLVTTDLAASLRFYRLLGLDIPDDVDSQPHVEVVAGGVRLMWDTVDTVESFGGPYTPPTGDAPWGQRYATVTAGSGAPTSPRRVTANDSNAAAGRKTHSHDRARNHV